MKLIREAGAELEDFFNDAPAILRLCMVVALGAFVAQIGLVAMQVITDFF